MLGESKRLDSIRLSSFNRQRHLEVKRAALSLEVDHSLAKRYLTEASCNLKRQHFCGNVLEVQVSNVITHSKELDLRFLTRDR